MEKVFLIGGSGFIGKNLVRYLYQRYELYVIDRFIDEKFFDKYPKANLLKINLESQKVPNTMECPDYIINLASIVTADRDLSLFDAMISSNLRVLLNLYDRFKGSSQLKLFIQFGSSEEYGSQGSPFVETQREEPNSPYALVKQLTTNTSMMLYGNYHFPIMVVRPGNLFGPYQNNSKFIPYVVDKLRANESLNVTFCEQKRDFIYVDDFSYIIEKLMINYEKAVGEIVNVSNGASMSLKDIVETCKNELKSTSEVNYGAIPYRANETMDLKCSVEKLEFIICEHIHFNLINRLKEYIAI